MYASIVALKARYCSDLYSLVPRPSHHPVFDCFAVCKNGGGRPVPFYHMNDISVYLGTRRRKGFPNEIMHFAHAFFVLNQEWYIFRFANIRNSSDWDRNYKKRPQARFSVFPYFKRSKLDGGRPGNEARCYNTFHNELIPS